MVSNINIQPNGAANAGCYATYSIDDEYTYEDSWYKLWRFTAFAADGWIFDHWEMSYSFQDVNIGGPSGNFTLTSRNNPWSGGAGSQEGTEEWDDTSWESYSQYQHTWRTITSLSAVFKRVQTGLILHSPTNLQIIHGAGGTILRDE